MVCTGWRLIIALSLFVLQSTVATPLELTEADIPSNLSPELRTLIARTFSTDAETRASAATKIGEMHETGAPATPFLIRLLKDAAVHSDAESALVAIGAPAVEPLIAAAVHLERTPGNPIGCLGKLQSKSERAQTALLAFLEDKDPYIRTLAAIALWDCTDHRAVSLLVKALDDPDNSVRSAAIHPFKTIQDSRSVEPLLKALKHPDRNARTDAIEALGNQRDSLATSALLDILLNRRPSILGDYYDEWDRHDAAVSLGTIGDSTAFEALVKAVWDFRLPTVVRSGVAMGLAKFHDEPGIYEILANVMTTRAPFELQVAVVQAIGEYGDPKAVEFLLGVVDSHGKNELAFWAAMSIVKISDGAINDLNVVRSIKEYTQKDDGNEMYVEEKLDALQKIEKNGTNVRVRLAAGGQEALLIVIPGVAIVAAIGLACMWIVIKKRKKRRSRR